VISKKLYLNFYPKKHRRLSEIFHEMYVPVSSLTTSIKDLYNTMIFEKPAEGKYGILDKVFRIWIKRNILKTENE
jgi:uncharacterized protein